MPRAQLTAARMTNDGVADPAEATGDPVDGHYVANTGHTIVTVRNADATNPHTVTFVTSATVGGKAVDDHAVSVAAATTRRFGGFATSVYGSALGIDADSAQLMLSALEP